MKRFRGVVSVILVALSVFPSVAIARKWTDSTGKYSVDAEFVETTSDGKAVLKRTDNARLISVPVNRLSEPDRAYIRELAAKPATKPAESPHENLPEGLQKEAPPILGNVGLITAICLSPEGTMLASGDYEKRVCVWDLKARQQIAALDLDAKVCSLSFSPSGDTLYCGVDGGLRIISADGWKVTQKIDAPWPGGSRKNAYVQAVAVTPDGKNVALGLQEMTGWDGAVVLLRNGKQALLRSGKSGPCAKVLFEGEDRLWCLFENGAVECWDLPSKKLTSTWLFEDDRLRQKVQARQIGFSKDGKVIVVGTPDHRLLVVDPASGKVLRTVNNWDIVAPTSSSGFGGTPLINFGVARGKDGNIRHTCAGRPADVKGGESLGHLDVDAKGQLLLSMGGSDECHVWDLKTGTILLSIPANGTFGKACFVPNTTTIVVVNKHYFCVWDYNQNKAVARISGD